MMHAPAGDVGLGVDNYSIIHVLPKSQHYTTTLHYITLHHIQVLHYTVVLRMYNTSVLPYKQVRPWPSSLAQLLTPTVIIRCYSVHYEYTIPRLVCFRPLAAVPGSEKLVTISAVRAYATCYPTLLEQGPILYCSVCINRTSV